MIIDEKVLSGVKIQLQVNGKLTCRMLAEKMQMPLASMVYFLRDALFRGALVECNGFYDVPRPQPQQQARPARRKPPEPEPDWCSFRRSLPWLEGNAIPSLVAEFARGVLTCESVYVVAEVDGTLQKRGYPHFTLACIDLPIGRFIDLMSGSGITAHVLRYLVIDRTPASERVPEAAK